MAYPGYKINKGDDGAKVAWSYARKLVTVISGGVFDLLDTVLERHSLDDVAEVI